MRQTKDYYELLEVGRDAQQPEIKSAYRRLARQCHPDVNPDDPKATERFRQLTEAYGVLIDPAKRCDYDRRGASFESGQVLNDIFARAEYRDVFSDLPPEWQRRLQEIARTLAIEAARGGRPQDILRRSAVTLGAKGLESAFHSVMDLHENITVSAEQASSGGSVTIEIRPGFRRKRLKVKLPKNLKADTILRIQGQGRRNFAKRSGDLYLHVSISDE